MSRRITKEDLNRVVRLLNDLCGTPQDEYVRDEGGKLQPQAFCYHLSWAYGGVQLNQMCKEGSGCRNVLRTGHLSKRETYELIIAYMNGMRDIIGGCHNGTKISIKAG